MPRDQATKSRRKRPEAPKPDGTQDSEAPGNVDKIRDILFGGQMRDYEKRSSKLGNAVGLAKSTNGRSRTTARFAKPCSISRKPLQQLLGRIEEDTAELHNDSVHRVTPAEMLGEMALRITDEMESRKRTDPEPSVTSSAPPPDSLEQSEHTDEQLAELRRLLFGREAAALEELRRRLGALEVKPEDVSRVLPRAIAMCGGADQELDAALAPSMRS